MGQQLTWLATKAHLERDRFGAKLNAIFGSDIGHFDVIDMRHPLPEAYELVEDGHITADDFRAFTFTKRSSSGARRTHAFSNASASPRKPPRCSPQRKPPTLAAE